MAKNNKNRIGSIEDLNAIQKRIQKEEQDIAYVVTMCSGAGCISSGCLKVKEAFVAALKEAGLSSKVKLKVTGCIGTCDVGPTMIIDPGGVFYCSLKPEDMTTVVNRHIISNEIVEELCYKDKNTGEVIPHLEDIGFFKQQKKIVLRNCGKIDYRSVDESVANGGYFALAKVLNEYSPEQVVNEVKNAGLRGRGGGGFPTGLKWMLARKSPGDQKYVICNADEGDPGAFMDRSLLEGDPHLIIEGMAIAGYAIGADKGYVYIRAEYPIAIERLEEAIKESEGA